MPFVSLDLLVAAAANLAGRHPLTVISIPALLRAAKAEGVPPTRLVAFGSAQEKVVLDSFKVREGKKPYLAVWQDHPQLVNHDYPGSTLQRLRTQDILGRSIFIDDAGPGRARRTKFGLRPEAGAALVAGQQPKVDKASLAVWLGRKVEVRDLAELIRWFDEEHPTTGTDLANFYIDDIPPSLRSVNEPFVDSCVEDELLLQRLAPNQVEETSLVSRDLGVARYEVEGFSWTQEVCQYPLAEADPVAITERVLADLRNRHIDLPDAENLVRRCVTALLVGHLILQGPPGTGKTTLARALARGFRCGLLESTATSEWSPFHVIGGLRPNPSGGLSPAHGKVVEAVLACAEVVRRAVNAEAGEGDMGSVTSDQAVWLLIDEFNRADIDKAVGSLYTMLSSCDPDHLATAPIDLWFESDPGSRQLWVPARFRIIGTMNDLDTSFVNAISQGLKRRFQFITVSVPTSRATADQPVTSEVEAAFTGAYAWLDRTYGATLRLDPVAQVRTALAPCIEALQRVVDGLRYPSTGPGWPIGTAQVVDILRTVLIRHATNPAPGLVSLDVAVADRLVPQLGNIDDEQYLKFRALFQETGLTASVTALNHLLDPHSVL